MFAVGLALGYHLREGVSEAHRHDLVLQGVDYGYWAVSQGTEHGTAVNALMNAWDD